MRTLLFILALFLISIDSYSQAPKYTYKEGDPRAAYFGSRERDIKKVADAYEAWREQHSVLLEQLGSDTDWEEDMQAAKKENGHIVVAEIIPGEDIELCMTPEDIQKVTHLKLTGRAYKWSEYDATATENFILRLKNLKVLNLRDLDCEEFTLESHRKLEKIVLPANCSAFGSSQFNNLKEIVFNNRLVVVGEAIKGTISPEYHTTINGLSTGKMKQVIFPEGVECISRLQINGNCEMITFPATLKEVKNLCLDRFIKQLNLKEIYIKSNTPPYIEKYNCKIKYEQAKNITLYVPIGSKDAYLKHIVWRSFNIVEK